MAMRKSTRGMLLPVLFAILPAEGRSAGDPLAPLQAAEWNLAAARHLLDRAGFGGTPEQIAALHALGLDAAVESLVAGEGALEGDGGDGDGGDFEARKLTRRYRDHALAMDEREMDPEAADGKDAAQELRRELARLDREQAAEFRAHWFATMVRTDDPLREKLALFWHGYFTSSQREVRDSHAMVHQIELYRDLGRGSFRELLHRASREPAMLQYLNAAQNKKQAPNENFAREVMELFTLGPGHYREDDVREAARAFTGWQLRNGEFFFNRKQHDGGEKSFLGKRGEFRGEDVLDILLEHEATAEFVARKLFTFFAHEEPGDAIVAGLAAGLRGSDYDVAALLKTLFRSRAFYAVESLGAQIKSPVEFVVSTVRRLAVAPPSGAFLAEAAAALGQDLLNPPNVKGWDGGFAWVSSSTLILRANLARVLVLGETALREERKARQDGNPRDGGMRESPFAGRMVRELKGYRPELDLEAWLGGVTTSSEAVARLCDRFLPVAPSRSTVAELARYAAPFGDDAFDPRDPESRRALAEVVHLVLCLPEYQLN
jgi:uncharacterized protein (DUF1800 family)